MLAQWSYQSTELGVIYHGCLLSVPTPVMYQGKQSVSITDTGIVQQFTHWQLTRYDHERLICVYINAAGVDYMPLSNFRIRWQADQVEPRYITNPTANDPTFEVIIIDDDILEPPGREYFEIDLTLNPTGNDRNGFFFPSAVGRVTIIDDDICKFLNKPK